MLKKLVLIASLTVATGCVTFNIGKTSNESIPKSKFSKLYLLIESEANNSLGRTFSLPSEVQLSKILPAVSDCDKLTTPAFRKYVSEAESDVSTVIVACEFYKELTAYSGVKWELVDRAEDAKDGVLYRIHLKAIVPTGTWRNIWGYASLFTLGIIPVWSFDHQVQMQASIYKVTTKDLPLSFQVNAKWGHFGQTLLILALPFRSPSKGFHEAYGELAKKLILKAAENNLY